MDPKIRKRLQSLVWKNTHKDFKGTLTQGGRKVKSILVLRQGGTTLVDLDSLTDEELVNLAPRTHKVLVDRQESQTGKVLRAWNLEGLRYYDVRVPFVDIKGPFFTLEEAQKEFLVRKITMTDIYINIENGVYTYKYEVASDATREDRIKARAIAREAQRELNKRFKADALAYVGLKGHPKADRAYEIAQERTSTRGELVDFLSELADLLR